MNKRILSALLSLAMFATLFPIIELKASAISKFFIDPQGVKYSKNYLKDSTATIAASGYTENVKENIIIPEEIPFDGSEQTVKNIGSGTFINCQNINSIISSNEITNISSYAFYGCKNLTTVYLGKKVNYVSSSAFFCCPNLERIIVDAENETFTIGEDGALYNKDQTKLIKIPSMSHNPVTGMPNTKYELPLSVKEIKPGAFDSCTHLTEINANKDSENFSSVDGILYNKTQTEIIAYPCGKTEPIFNVPVQVEKVALRTFANCQNLIAINANSESKHFSSVDGALYDNFQTELFAYPAGKPSDDYTPPQKLQVISSYAFAGCTHLKTLTLPGTIESLEVGIFEGCINLDKVIIPDSTEIIHSFAFIGCTNLHTMEIEFESDLIIAERKIFCGCPRDLKIYINDYKESHMYDRNYRIPIALYNEKYHTYFSIIPCLEDVLARPFISEFTDEEIKEKIQKAHRVRKSTMCKNGSRIDYVIQTDIKGNNIATLFAFLRKEVTDVDLPDTVCFDGKSYTLVKISSHAFPNRDKIETVNMSDSITKIGQRAFRGCPSLKKVTFSKNLIKIGDSAFCDCSNLEEVNLPNSLNVIGEWAFFKCSTLSSVDIPNGMREINGNSFAQGAIKTINIPPSVVEFSGTLQQKAVVHPDNKIFSSDDTGVIFSKDKTILIRWPWTIRVHIYNVPLNVITIGTDAFSPSTREPGGVTLVKVHKNVTNIEKGAFYFQCVLIESGSKLEQLSDCLGCCYYLECDKGTEEYTRLSRLIKDSTPSADPLDKSIIRELVVENGVEYGLTENDAIIFGYKDKSSKEITIKNSVFYRDKEYPVHYVYTTFENCPEGFKIRLPYEKDSAEDKRLRGILDGSCESSMIENCH